MRPTPAKDALLEAACQLFYTQGIRGTSVEALLMHPHRNAPIQTLELSNTGVPAAMIIDAGGHLGGLTELRLAGAPCPASSADESGFGQDVERPHC